MDRTRIKKLGTDPLNGNDASENLILMCLVCARGDCSYGTIVDETMAKGCRCCEVEHNTQALAS